MKRTMTQLIPVIALGCGALLYSMTGCSKAPEGPPVAVSISCDDTMKYDVRAFEAKPGQKVVVTISNKGTTPKFSMGHNFVLLDRTVNMGNVQSWLDKASTEAAHDYVSPGSKEVLAHSKLLGPGGGAIGVAAASALHVALFQSHLLPRLSKASLSFAQLKFLEQPGAAERIGHIDSGLVASQVEQVRQAFHESFNAAFTGTMRLSMILPIAIALLVILLMNGKRKRGSDVQLAENSFRTGTPG